MTGWMLATEAQRAHWRTHHDGTDAAACNLAIDFAINADVRPELLERSVRTAVGEAEALRLEFAERDEALWQRARPAPRTLVSWHDVRTESDPVGAARAWLETSRSFARDPRSGPLFDHHLVQVGEHAHHLHFGLHHLLMDGYSIRLHLRRVAAVYTALHEHGVVRPSSSAPYGELLAEHALEHHFRGAAAREFWLDELAGTVPQPSLSGKPPARPYRSLVHEKLLPPQVCSSMTQVAENAAGRWSTVWMAAVFCYLHLRTGAEDLVVGLSAATRTGRAARTTAGVLSNVLPLRVRVRGDHSFRDVVREVARKIVAATRHQHYRRERILDDAGHPELLRTFVNPMPFGGPVRFGAGSARYHGSRGGPISDLKISVVGTPRADDSVPRLTVEANPALYSQDELIAHGTSFAHLLGRLARTAERPVREAGGIACR